MKIHKVRLFEDASDLILDVPKHTNFLTVQRQNGNIVIWYSFEKESEQIVLRRLVKVGAGQEVNGEHLAYIATVQEDMLVWHFFEDLAYVPN